MKEISRICFIYGLADPLSGNIRYIGRSINPKERYRFHVRTKKRLKTHKDFWIASLRKLGILPELIILETTTEEKSIELEIFWIAEYRSIGFNLTNSTDGGEGILGYSHTDETKKILSDNHIGKSNGLGYKHTEESKEIMREKSKLNWTEERRNKQAEVMKLRWTPEYRKIHSDKMKGNQTRTVSYTQERRLAASERMKGNNHAIRKLS